jgi:hypothetical protein
MASIPLAVLSKAAGDSQALSQFVSHGTKVESQKLPSKCNPLQNVEDCLKPLENSRAAGDSFQDVARQESARKGK